MHQFHLEDHSSPDQNKGSGDDPSLHGGSPGQELRSAPQESCLLERNGWIFFSARGGPSASPEGGSARRSQLDGCLYGSFQRAEGAMLGKRISTTSFLCTSVFRQLWWRFQCQQVSTCHIARWLCSNIALNWIRSHNNLGRCV